MSTTENTNLVLISGKTATGKSASLMGLEDPESVMYLNCENNKKLPFKSKFQEYTITDPHEVPEAFTFAETQAHIRTVITDTLTYLMEMYEAKYVLTAADSRKAWGGYASYFKSLMFNNVATSSKNAIFLAHTADIINESEMVKETLVKVKGSLMNQGIESYFSCVLSTKKIPIKMLVDGGYQSPMLNISADDEDLGFKYVFQTRPTRDTFYERIRSPLGMWTKEETFIDNNVQHVIARLHEYYK